MIRDWTLPLTLLAAMLAPLTSCKISDQAAPKADSSFESRVARLESAKVIEWWTGDFDGDHIADLALVPAEANAGHATVGLSSQALEAAPFARVAIVFVHDHMGLPSALPSNRSLDFASAVRIVSTATSTLYMELQALSAQLRRAQKANCNMLASLASVVEAAVAKRLVTEEAVDTIFRTLMSPFGLSELAQGPTDETSQCLRTGQTAVGCIGIWVSTACGTSTDGICAYMGRRPHHYEVKGADGSSHNELCKHSDHASGCCNADFIYEKVFQSDLRNMAPMPVNPSSGPLPPLGQSETVTLDGLQVPFDWIAAVPNFNLQLALCVFNGVATTRNPINLSVQPDQHSATNETQSGHVLQGTVTQRVLEDGETVYSTIVGDSAGQDTRFAGLNELIGPHVLGTVRDIFQMHVATALERIDDIGACCEGAVVHGARVTVPGRDGIPDIQADGTDKECSPLDAGSDEGMDAAMGQTDAGLDAGSADAATEAGIGRALSCGMAGRYRVLATGAWNDEVLDTQTGKVWHRTNERVNGLQQCAGTFGRLQSDDPLCCRLAATEPTYAKCNWVGAQQLCESLGMRLPTKDELVEVAYVTGTCGGTVADDLESCAACVLNWESWSATAASDTTAFYLRSNLIGVMMGTDTINKKAPNGNFGVRCVRDP